MIYITGDCHGDFERFSKNIFPEQNEMTKDDYVIICGDFGGVWNKDTESPKEKWWLNWLQEKSFTTLFVDGNHENFDRLYNYRVEEWHGGKVHKIRPSVIHLMRGQIFTIDGKEFLPLAVPGVMISMVGFWSRMIPNSRQRRKNWIRDGSHIGSII